MTIVMTVIAPDVAQALTAAWWTFRKAVGNDMEGWDMAGAIAEVRPGEHYPRGFKEQDGPDGPGIQRDDVATRTHERPALRPLLTGTIYLACTSEVLPMHPRYTYTARRCQSAWAAGTAPQDGTTPVPDPGARARRSRNNCRTSGFCSATRTGPCSAGRGHAPLASATLCFHAE